jgi:hypothetical protein
MSARARPPELVLETRVAHAFYEEHLYFDRLLFAELLGHESMVGLLAYAVTGHAFSKDELALIDDLAVIVNVADPRIWPLKLTRIASSYGSFYSAYAAGNLCMERALSGTFACGRAANLLIELKELVALEQDDAAIADAVEKLAGTRPPGFGVPFRGEDERIAAMRPVIVARRRDQLPYWRLFERVELAMRARRGLRPNVSLPFAAVSLDLGVPRQSVAPFATALAQNAFLANAIEGAAQAPAVLRSLPASAVEYQGRPPRKSPRAP